MYNKYIFSEYNIEDAEKYFSSLCRASRHYIEDTPGLVIARYNMLDDDDNYYYAYYVDDYMPIYHLTFNQLDTMLAEFYFNSLS